MKLIITCDDAVEEVVIEETTNEESDERDA
jgi:hypothetical protein